MPNRRPHDHIGNFNFVAADITSLTSKLASLELTSGEKAAFADILLSDVAGLSASDLLMALGIDWALPTNE